LKPNVVEKINDGVIIYTPLSEDKRNFLEKLVS
jgi:hypothetical protein